MTGIILSQIQLGGYISPVKLAVYLLLLLLWMPLINWVYRDSQDIRTAVGLWTGLNFAIPAVAAVLWLMIPFYVIGLLLFVIAVAAITMVYVMHRNSLVSSVEKILTVSHIKSLLSNDGKKAAKAVKGYHFITANNNEVETPEYKTPDFFGFEIVQEIIDDAVWKRADDITFLPKGEEYDIYYKIDGVAIKQEPKSREDVEYLTRFIKQLADIDISEKRKPQTGIFKAKKDNDSYVFRVNTAGSTAGEKIIIVRMKDGGILKIDELGLTSNQLEKLKEISQSDGGIFLITGPKGSGLSATFYACMKNHDPFLNNINTIEKKEGKKLDNVTQVYYKLSDTGTMSYGRRIQSMFRTGPDIVGVADCEEAEAAKILLNNVAKDKKIIYACFSAPSVIQAMAKWFKLTGDRNLATDFLLGLSCQRLVRKLCPDCREAYEPNKEVFRKFNIPADKVKILYRKGEIEYDKHGRAILCQTCQGTGYLGRTGIFETIFFTDELKSAIKKAKSLQEIANLFRKAKMLYLQEQAIRKVADGITSIDEVIREFAPKGPAKRPGNKK